MSPQIQKLCAVLLGSALLTAQVHAAMIVPTGGSAAVSVQAGDEAGRAQSETLTIGTSSDAFSVEVSIDARAHHDLYYPEIAVARVDGLVFDSSIRIAGAASARHYFGEDLYPRVSAATASGHFGFETVSPLSMLVDWTQVGGSLGITRVNLSNADGIVLSCDAEVGCTSGSNQFAESGVIALAAGRYDLSFFTQSDQAMNLAISSNFSLNLTPVPLLPALYFFASGLGGLLLAGKRRMALRT